MALIDERFAAASIDVTGIDQSEQHPVAHVGVSFFVGGDGTQQGSLIAKRTQLDPATAIAVGEALVEEGKRLQALAPKIEVAQDLSGVASAAAAVRQADAALRA